MAPSVNACKQWQSLHSNIKYKYATRVGPLAHEQEHPQCVAVTTRLLHCVALAPQVAACSERVLWLVEFAQLAPVQAALLAAVTELAHCLAQRVGVGVGLQRLPWPCLLTLRP